MQHALGPSVQISSNNDMDHYFFEIGSQEMASLDLDTFHSLFQQTINTKMQQRYAHTDRRFFTEQMKKDYKEELCALEVLLENEQLTEDEIADGNSDLKLEAALHSWDTKMVKGVIQERVFAAVQAAHCLPLVQALGVHSSHCSTSRVHANGVYATHCSTAVHAAVNAAVNARMLDVDYIETHWTPIALALHYNDRSSLDFILQMGGNPNMISFGRSLLFTACLDNSLTHVEVLVKYGANTDRKEFGRTMIEHATRFGHTDVVEYLKKIKWIKRRRAWATVFASIKHVDSDEKIFVVMQCRDLAWVIASYL